MKGLNPSDFVYEEKIVYNPSSKSNLEMDQKDWKLSVS